MVLACRQGAQAPQPLTARNTRNNPHWCLVTGRCNSNRFGNVILMLQSRLGLRSYRNVMLYNAPQRQGQRRVEFLEISSANVAPICN